MNLKKILNIVEISLLGIAALSVILWVFGVFGPFEHSKDAFGGADVVLIITYVYMAVSLLLLVGMTIANVGKSRKNSKIGMIVYGTMVVLAVVLYFVGSSTPVIGADGTVFDSVFTLKMTDMMLYLAYVALGAVVAILLAGEIRSAIK